jgi:hypothetical protein
MKKMATIKYEGIAIAQYLWLTTMAIQSIDTSLANDCNNFDSKLQHWIHMNCQSLLVYQSISHIEDTNPFQQNLRRLEKLGIVSCSVIFLQ